MKEKVCEYCGKPIIRKIRNNGRLETEKVFQARRFCDRNCTRKAKQKQYMESIEPKICEQCGKEFIPTKHDDRIRFCSVICNREWRKHTDYMKRYNEKNKDKLKEKRRKRDPVRNERRRSRYQEDEGYREYAKRRAREYYHNNPDAKLKQHLSKYGLTIDEYNSMFNAQNGKCAICGSYGDESKPHRKLYIDHNHMTGNVRGLLCHKCNFMIGQANDDTSILQKGIDYLRKYEEVEENDL